jgi:hypothetical protein
MGYGMITIPTIINFYYTVIMAYAFLFLFLGFTSTLPWSECGHDYNTENCHSITQVLYIGARFLKQNYAFAQFSSGNRFPYFGRRVCNWNLCHRLTTFSPDNSSLPLILLT